MARDVGLCKFIQRDADEIKIQILDSIETYKVLRVIEFTSDRKRMSVIVKNMNNNKMTSFVKGADTTMIPKIKGECNSD